VYRKKISIANIRFVNAFLIGESSLVVLLGVVVYSIPRIFPAIEPFVITNFIIILLYLIAPINEILQAIPAVMQFKVAWKRIRQFLKEIPAGAGINASPPEFRAVKIDTFRVEGIKFTYKDESEQDGFTVGPIDLEVRGGQILFIIGGNGGGKTTLAKLLCGLYEPDEGRVLIDNDAVRGIRLSEYFSAVFSPVYLFEKIYNVDLSGKQGIIREYLKILKLENKVEIDGNKYSTINLSGGQRKRLALLQCYLEDSPIYLFDEWAADQDPEYRNFFYRTLLPEMKRSGKIVIAITHDDHYFDVADMVLEVKDGQIRQRQHLQGGIPDPHFIESIL
jgi:cyclic peptide transporter